MPAKSKAQQRLMAAASHGADFPMAQKVRESMPLSSLADFASGSMKGKPERVPQSKSSFNPAQNLGKYHHPRKGSK